MADLLEPTRPGCDRRRAAAPSSPRPRACCLRERGAVRVARRHAGVPRRVASSRSRAARCSTATIPSRSSPACMASASRVVSRGRVEVIDVAAFHDGTPKPKRRIARAIAGIVRRGVPRHDHACRSSSVSGRYEVIVGAGARHELAGLCCQARRAAGRDRHAARRPVAVDPGIEHRRFTIGRRARARSRRRRRGPVPAFARWGLTRADVVVGVGGGVVTDTAGFAAAVYHRGVAVVHVPTTLLGMIDAAIGGKTGVNLPRARTWSGVLATGGGAVRHRCAGDVAAARTAQRAAASWPSTTSSASTTWTRCRSTSASRRASLSKPRSSAADEREGPGQSRSCPAQLRAHARARARDRGRYDLRHGEAVAIGLVYAAELAQRLGRIDAARVAEHRRVVGRIRPAGATASRRRPRRTGRADGRDKKAVDGLTFVLDGPDGVEVVTGVDPATVIAALEDDRIMSKPSVLLLSGPNLNLLGVREPDIYGTATLDRPRRPASRRQRRARGLVARAPAVEPRGRVGRRPCTAPAAAAPPSSINPGALTHYGWSLHDALAVFDGVVVELHLSNPHRPRAVAAHVGRQPRWRTAASWGFGGHGYALAVEAVARLLGTMRDRGRLAADGRRRRGSRGPRAHRTTPAADALLVTNLAQHALPHRFHRVGRAAARPARRRSCSSPTAATASQAAEQLARAGVDGASRASADWPEQTGTASPPRRPASGRLGLEADDRHVGAAACVRRGRGSRPRSSSPTEGLVEALRRIEGRRRDRPAHRSGRASPTTRWRRRGLCSHDDITEEEFATRARLRDAPARRRPARRSRPSSRPARTAPSRTHRPSRPAQLSQGELVVLDFGALRRRLLLRHDPHCLRSANQPIRRHVTWSTLSREAQAGRRGRGPRRRRGRRPSTTSCRDRHRRGRVGRRVHARHRARRGPRTSTRPRGSPRRRLTPWRPAMSSPSSPACTSLASAASASRTRSWSPTTARRASPTHPKELQSVMSISHQRSEERHDARPARGPVPGRRVPARQAGQGRRVRAHQAQERAHRRGSRPHLPRRREARAGHHRQARDAVPVPRRRATTCSWTTPPTTSCTSTPMRARRRRQVPQGRRHRGRPAVQRRDRRRRPAGGRRAARGHRDRARRRRATASRPAQAGHARDRPRVQVPLFIEHRRSHQGRHPHRATTSLEA